MLIKSTHAGKTKKLQLTQSQPNMQQQRQHIAEH